MPEVGGVNLPFLPIGGVEGVRPHLPLPPEQSGGGRSFKTLFDEELSRVRFSSHAEKRLASRNIELSEANLRSLNSAVAQAAEKGGRESLIMMKDMAFIVNIPNRTVVTALDGELLSNAVFTNIDSAVFAA